MIQEGGIILMRISLLPEYFAHIKAGHKTVEGRIAKEKYQQLLPNDTLEFCAGDDSVKASVQEVRAFDSFDEMLDYFGVASCLPGVSSMEEALKIYRSFPDYPKLEMSLGVVGVRFSLIEGS